MALKTTPEGPGYPMGPVPDLLTLCCFFKYPTAFEREINTYPYFCSRIMPRTQIKQWAHSSRLAFQSKLKNEICSQISFPSSQKFSKKLGAKPRWCGGFRGHDTDSQLRLHPPHLCMLKPVLTHLVLRMLLSWMGLINVQQGCWGDIYYFQHMKIFVFVFLSF